MALLKIAQIGNPLLRERSVEVTPAALATAEMQTFIDDLIETMRDANGAGLAAPQVHRLVRICAIEVKDNPRYPYKPNIPLTILVNPVITPASEERFDNYEGCLSVPNLRGMVERFTDIDVRYLDRNGVEQTRRVAGLTAGTYQHECDHLDGKLFVDRVGDPTTLSTLAEFDRYHKQAFVERVVKLVARKGG